MMAMEWGWLVVWAVTAAAAAWLVLVLSVAIHERRAERRSSQPSHAGSEDDVRRPAARAA